MKHLSFCLLIFLWSLVAAHSAASAATPNIIFIMADDLGWADVSFHQGNVPTPYLDRLASEGVELAVDRKGIRNETIVIFTSDNGGSTVENNDLKYPDGNCPNGKLTGNNLPFRGQKGQVYEGGIRVPTIVSAPGRLKPQKFNGVAHISDWMPTICEMVGYKATQDLKWDGQNVWPQLTGEVPIKPRSIYTAAPGFNVLAMRHGDWKLIVPKGNNPANPKRETEAIELYDLANDPYETKNLASSMSDKVIELQTKLAEASQADRDAIARDKN